MTKLRRMNFFTNYDKLVTWNHVGPTSQTAIIPWTNVGIWLAVFVVRCCQMTLARCYFCWSDRPRRQRVVRSWPIALKPTIHAYANVMPIVLFQVSHLANVGPTWFQVTSLLYVLYCTTCMNEALRKKGARKQTRKRKKERKKEIMKKREEGRKN